MVSLGILAVALMALGDLNGGAVRMHAYSKRLTAAVQLARGKMLDLRQVLREDGVGDFTREYKGDFSAEGEPDYKWRAVVVKPEFELDPQMITSAIASQFGMDLDGQQAGGPQADAAGLMGGISGMIETQANALSETFKQSVREVRLTVSWRSGSKEESFDVVEHMVILPNDAQNAVLNAQPMTPGSVPTPQTMQQQGQQPGQPTGTPQLSPTQPRPNFQGMQPGQRFIR